MGFIIKPVVTEKMNAVTEKSSVDKTIKVANEKSAKKHNAVAETRNYVVKNKRHPEGLKKEKTVYSYVKQAQPKYGFIVKPEANKFEIKKEYYPLCRKTSISLYESRTCSRTEERF